MSLRDRFRIARDFLHRFREFRKMLEATGDSLQSVFVDCSNPENPVLVFSTAYGRGFDLPLIPWKGPRA